VPVAAHDCWVVDFNYQAHWTHPEREDGRHSPAEVLAWDCGRRLTRAGYVRFRHWRLYGECGLADEPLAIWLYGQHLTIAFADEALAQYRAGPTSAGHGQRGPPVRDAIKVAAAAPVGAAGRKVADGDPGRALRAAAAGAIRLADTVLGVGRLSRNLAGGEGGTFRSACAAQPGPDPDQPPAKPAPNDASPRAARAVAIAPARSPRRRARPDKPKWLPKRAFSGLVWPQAGPVIDDGLLSKDIETRAPRRIGALSSSYGPVCVRLRRWRPARAVSCRPAGG
jgi:hypothetical protein